MELADTSAWISPHRGQAFNELVVEGEIAICEVVELELLSSARDGSDFAERRDALAALPQLSIGEPEWRRACDVIGRVEPRVKVPALIVAATAELAAFAVVHDDDDFEAIAAVTRQPTRRLESL
jgi:hypothetical protein